MPELEFSNPSLATATKNKKKKGAKKKSGSKGGKKTMAKKKSKKKGTKKKGKKNAGASSNAKKKSTHRGGKKKTKKKGKGKKNPKKAKRNRSLISTATSSFKAQPKTLMKSAGPIVLATGLNRVDDRISNTITGLVNVQKDSPAGKAMRVGGAVVLGVLIDAFMGREKKISWSWGEFARNMMIINVASDVLAQDIEPRFGGGAAQITTPAGQAQVVQQAVDENGDVFSFVTEAEPTVFQSTPAASPTGGTVQQTSPAAVVSGMNGVGFIPMNGMGRGGMGAMVSVPVPVFDRN